MSTSEVLRAIRSCALLPLAVLLAATTSARGAEAGGGHAAINFNLNCSGCHREDGTGQPGLVPALAGTIGKVYAAPGGREYIGRIPGVANSFLNDEELSDVLNWLLPHFDSQHLPADFHPYTAAEVGRLRKNPMSDAMTQRAALMSRVAEVSAPVPTSPPASFALCAACHPTSGSANGIGPNLRGIVGRPAGTAPGYLYSAAMKSNPVVWDPDALNHYIESPATAVPGNAMTFRGEPDPSERAAIIAYLKTLK